jgi:hypothetical protein
LVSLTGVVFLVQKVQHKNLALGEGLVSSPFTINLDCESRH